MKKINYCPKLLSSISFATVLFLKKKIVQIFQLSDLHQNFLKFFFITKK